MSVTRAPDRLSVVWSTKTCLVYDICHMNKAALPFNSVVISSFILTTEFIIQIVRHFVFVSIVACQRTLIDISMRSSVCACVCHEEAFEEITTQSPGVLVTHALLAAAWFPHSHGSEVRKAAPTPPSPPAPLRVPAKPMWAGITRPLEKKTRKRGGKKLNLACAQSKQQPASHNASVPLWYHYDTSFPFVSTIKQISHCEFKQEISLTSLAASRLRNHITLCASSRKAWKEIGCYADTVEPRPVYILFFL